MNEAKKIDKPQGNGVLPCVSGSDLLKYGKKTKTKKGNTDCDECKYKDGSNENACFSCPDKNGFGYHYR